jgi:glycosyltransferase involved in cell wall biosynthesis
MPTVSVIVPCYNEQDTIRMLLLALRSQTFPTRDMEVVIADGISTDGTIDEIEKFQDDHPDLLIRVVENNKRNIPSGLNLAIGAAEGEIIVRLDAHSVPKDDYVERCVEAISLEKGDNVGGVWEIQPGANHWIAKSIALAAAHPLGVGDARYRLGGHAQPVDTVPFGAYRRSLIDRIGPYNETLLTNEDYEFNVRIRQSGGTVWFDPNIRSGYFARPTLTALAKQYWRYGFWKGRMLRRYPETLRLRQLLPPLFVLSVSFLIVGGIFFEVFRYILMAIVCIYLLALIFAGALVSLQRRSLAHLLGLPLAIATMHITWGSALLWSLIRR